MPFVVHKLRRDCEAPDRSRFNVCFSNVPKHFLPQSLTHFSASRVSL